MLDLYNRRTDPFDPLDSPVGDHIVTEVVRRMDAASERRPDLALDQINNVRPTSMVPTWIVANFFYRFLSRALGDFALPLLGLFLLLHVPVVAVLAGGLWSRLGTVGELSTSVLQWAIVIAAVDLVLLVAVFAFVGRSLQQAVSTYGGSPSELSSKTGEDSATRRARSARLLGQRDPAARLLLHGHSHQAAFTHLDEGRIAVDSGCWIRALVPVRAWLDLPRSLFPATRAPGLRFRPRPRGPPWPCGSVRSPSSIDRILLSACWREDRCRPPAPSQPRSSPVRSWPTSRPLRAIATAE
jgi:hypothetical protein